MANPAFFGTGSPFQGGTSAVGGWLNNILAGGLNSNFQLGGQNNKSFANTQTYSPQTTKTNTNTNTYSPTSNFQFAPVTSSNTNYSPQGIYSPQFIQNSPYAGGVSAGLSPTVSASLNPNTNSGAFGFPQTNVVPSVSPSLVPTNTTSQPNTSFDFSAILPFIIVLGVLIVAVKYGGLGKGGKK